MDISKLNFKDEEFSRQEGRGVDQTMENSQKEEAPVKAWRGEGVWPVQELRMVHGLTPHPRAFTLTAPLCCE